MFLVRRIAIALIVAASLAVLALSLYLLWNTPGSAGLDSAIGRIYDLETILIILLGIAALYVIVFILAADFNARAIRRQVDRAVDDLTGRIGASLTEFQGLKDETSDALRDQAKEAAERFELLNQQAREILGQLSPQASGPVPAAVLRDLDTIHQRVSAIADSHPTDEQVQEVLHYEGALPALELLYSRDVAPQLARIYRDLARYFRHRDAPRARFYLNRAAAMAPEDFETSNELGSLALDGRQSPDYRQARRHFEASLAVQPSQQRAKYGLALIARAEGDFETAVGLLESAIESENWETRPDPRNTALIHYALACVLARRGQEAPVGYRAQYLVRSTQHLQAAFKHPSRQLEQMLLSDIEDGGDLVVLAGTSPYEDVVNDLLLNLSVGAA